MTKQEFIANLRARLSALPKEELEERISFYCEIIDDRTEEGLSEEEAVSAIGSVDEIAEQIISDIPLSKIVKEKVTPKRRFKVWEIVLLALGSPVWLSLSVAAVAVILSLYVSLWSIIASLWAVFASFTGSAFGVIIAGCVFIFTDFALVGLSMIGASLILAGVAVFSFFGCKAATKGIIALTKKMALGTKKLFLGGEEKR